jgi:hypothetical protein
VSKRTCSLIYVQKNATYDGLLNGANDLFKTTCMNNKS